MEFCNECPKSFSSKSGLLSHIYDSHRTRDFSVSRTVWRCDRCRKSFAAEHSLMRHKEDVIHDLEDLLDNCKDINRYSKSLQMGWDYQVDPDCVVHDVVQFFHRSPLFKVTRIIKGGSLGKGTAIRSKSDIDLVMFISDLPPVHNSSYNRQLQHYLAQIEDTINTIKRSAHVKRARRGPPLSYDIELQNSLRWTVEMVGRTNHAVKLTVKSRLKRHARHDVDLLLAKDLAEDQLGPIPLNWYTSPDKKEEVYDMMWRLHPSARENCSAALVELQLDFVEQQPSVVKDLIRVVKMWNKSCVEEPTLTSYPLELLCIHTWPHGVLAFNYVAAVFKKVLEKLCDYNNICAFWTHNYSYSRVVPMLGKRPLILDPANPYNNVADRCRNWPAVARAAQETLQKPFFSR